MNTVARATAYAALAAIFRPPSDFGFPINELLAALESLNDGLACTWREALTLSGRGLVSRSDNGSASLDRTYNRLFVGPLPPLAHPYESVYRTPEGQLMGQVTLQVIQAYAEAGLSLTNDSRELLPDHVAVELEFMAYLAGEEAKTRADGDEDLVVTHLARQAAFLRDHLTRWIPHFCHRVIEADPDGFYGQAAVMLATFVVHDLGTVSDEWRAASDGWQVTNGDLLNTRHPLPTTRHRAWEVSFHPKRKIPCTLCGICAEVCRQDALRFVKNEGEVALTFDPTSCDGCDYCRKYCPERILQVKPVAASTDNGQTRRLAASAMASCARCGASLAIPEAMLGRVLERFRRRKGNPDDEAAMHLCHACKVGATSATAAAQWQSEI